MIKVDKGVPMPKAERTQLKPRESKYPWASMEVGDSFEVAGKTTKNFGTACYAAGKRLGKKFAARATDTGVRVWRTV